MVGCYLINPDSIIKREGYRFVTDSLLSQLAFVLGTQGFINCEEGSKSVIFKERL